ncbi:hypothetical protein V8F06_004426 [Rhypophila decipiens]
MYNLPRLQSAIHRSRIHPRPSKMDYEALPTDECSTSTRENDKRQKPELKSWFRRRRTRFAALAFVFLLAFLGVFIYDVRHMNLSSSTLKQSELAAAVETCGTSPQEAVSRGCRFDVMSFAWLPAPCFDKELMADFLVLRDWRWYMDRDGTQIADAAAAARGEYDRLYVTQEYHMYHCTYMWRKMHRAIRHRWPLDGYIGNMEHTAHCEAMLVTDAGMRLDATNTAIVSKYVQCPVSGQDLGDAGWYRMVDGARVHGFGGHHHP